MKTQIYFVRHGDVNNPQEIVYGRLPGYELSEKGRLQVAQSAQFLKDMGITQIYASPLLRTKQTAEIINEALRLPDIHFSGNLLEIRTHLEGLPNADIQPFNADFYADSIRTPDDETIQDVIDRMTEFCKEVVRNHAGENVVAVSHGDPIMIFKSFIQDGWVTIESIRPGMDMYLHHAQVLRIDCEADKLMAVSEVFDPHTA